MTPKDKLTPEEARRRYLASAKGREALRQHELRMQPRVNLEIRKLVEERKS